MALDSSETPNFGSNPEPARQYDDHQIARRVIWPLVNRYAYTDWQEESALTDTMDRKIRGAYNGEQVDVIIAARNEVMEADEDPNEGVPFMGVAEFIIENIVMDENRDEILRGAAPMSDGKIDSENWDEVAVKEVVEYTFGRNGLLSIDEDKKVEDFNGDILWLDSSDCCSGEESERDNAELEEDIMSIFSEDFSPDDIIFGQLPNAKLYKGDMRRLESGLIVLRPTNVIRAAFEAVRANPLRSQG